MAIKIALTGNPNCGKTTLFNNLTGSSAHVGNWPGVTVERREGKCKTSDKKSEEIIVVDLPGIYSLSPYSPEERISRNFLLDDKPDVIVNVINVMNFERSLYLTTQILETDSPVVLALNMIDVLEKQQGSVDIRSIESLLGVPVVTISALRGSNTGELINLVLGEAKKKKRTPQSVLKKCTFGDNFNKIAMLLERENIGNPIFVAAKIIEGDMEIEEKFGIKSLRSYSVVENNIKTAAALCRNNDIEAEIADLRYRYICDYVTAFVKNKQTENKVSPSERADRIFTHKIFGIPIFLGMMFLIFHLTFSESLFGLSGINSPGVLLKTLMESGIDALTAGLNILFENFNASEWASGLFIGGVWAGVSSVLTFIPQILLLFLFLSILEDSGYMARAAFIMDKLLKSFGLSGKSFVPMLMGFGCSVPAIMATRTIENENDRKITLMLVPFMSCGAKFPLYALFISVFFPQFGDFAVFGIYLFGVAMAIFSGIFLKKFVFKGEQTPFIMEMPDYHFPGIQNLIIHLWEKLKHFIIKAGTLIASATVVIWILQNFSFGFKLVDPNNSSSMLAHIGNFIRPIFVPLGFASGNTGWIAVVAILTGFIAKEAIVSTVTQLSVGIAVGITALFSPPAALSFVIFNLLCIPCFAAVGTIKKELGSVKLFIFTLGFQFIIAWTASFLIFNAVRLFIH